MARVAADKLTVLGAVDDLTATAAAAREASFQLAAARQAVLDAVRAAQAAGLTVDDDYTVTSTGRGSVTAARADALAAVLHAKVLALAALDRQVATQISTAASGVQSLGFGQGPAPQAPPAMPAAPSEADRKRNQSTAFEKVFGHPPLTGADWQTAAALDPHSYDPKNQGVPPNIVVGRIKPVPGQGVVKDNLFIPGETAWAPSGDNLGDHRGFDPNAGPEDARVSIYTDFENGVVVARQNPSVVLGSDGTEVRAGSPDISVSQNPNGSVRIQYSAADPFSPGGEDLAKLSPWNVHGDLVIKPTASGPVAGGLISDFPASEIYGVRGGQTIELAKIMPQNVGELGPLAGLPLSNSIGQSDLRHEFPMSASPTPMARVPPVVIPYPSVQLGPVTDIPQVPVGR
ncbi:hypothetical protein CIW49_26230 [Mycolicibacterium sp. P1-18]|nr:hypothetical protein CIW49_26230 [Mycolicibacterium sp. P1-18]